ncbi:hypothetical protein MPL1032_300013 [Mesorhizobium plurifarium]|uniref:Uncharacterized protein n=1 Tax=Mesorhizobium plurifarium TaxID=69974 RepID=A0A0K2W4A0_MESPL|nr:hypothetical protein MPL1032_300013 [Mesorhizobium plurifarium]
MPARRAVLLFIEAVKARFKPILSFKGHGKWAQPRTAPPPGSPIWRWRCWRPCSPSPSTRGQASAN